MIGREIENQIKKKLFKGKAILIYGARQTGKTTLVNRILEGYKDITLSVTGDDPKTRTMFNDLNLNSLKRIIGKHEILFVDEAQRFQDIGLTTGN